MKLVPFKVESFQNMVNEIPWGVQQLQAPEIWANGEKGKGVIIAICDTGIDRNHPDLSGQIIGGRNFTNEGSADDFTDNNSHGTHVAGIIAASANESGVVGVAPEAKLLICKVLNREGSGDYSSIINGIRWATNWRGPNGEKVRIINMSLGGPYNDPNMYKAILEAVAAGILIVVASGNEGDANPNTYEYGYPALYNECITVAACDENKKLAYFSNEHLQVDAIAAGVNVVSTYPPSRYATLSGTSMATPHISGALALVINIGEKQFKRTLTESEIFALLVKCCCSLDYPKSSEGNGLPELSQIYKQC
ncbi:S8 family peptidase [Bacillus sp. ISL-75]|nr:S8 family peptidase [Bacillus sp. ISL-75]